MPERSPPVAIPHRQPMLLFRGSIPCAACAGAHRKHTCSIHLRQPTEAPVNAVAPLLLPVKKRLSSTAPAVDRDDKVASGCAACAGGHRKHTCGKAALPPPTKVALGETNPNPNPNPNPIPIPTPILTPTPNKVRPAFMSSETFMKLHVQFHKVG